MREPLGCGENGVQQAANATAAFYSPHPIDWEGGNDLDFVSDRGWPDPEMPATAAVPKLGGDEGGEEGNRKKKIEEK